MQKRKKIKNRTKNYSKSKKAKLRIFSNGRGQYLYTRAKPRGISLNLKYFSFVLLKILDIDLWSDDTVRRIIASFIKWQQNSAVERKLTGVLNNWNKCSETF